MISVRTRQWIVWSVLLLVSGVAVGCASPSSAPSYKQRILQHRMQRDMNLRDKNSVLTRSVRERFKGLRYFPVDSTYRFIARFDRFSGPDTVLMPVSTGGAEPHYKVGQVTIDFPQGTEQLTVFRARKSEEELWIPFADATNGEATYPAGRYVNAGLVNDSTVLVDFNLAYNPTCDYNPTYTCPLAPSENHLPFRVPVGEKKSMLHAY